MTENSTNPAPTSPQGAIPESSPAQPAVKTVTEPELEVDATPFTPDEPETEVEIADEEKIEKPENQFDDLDEELVDIHESADTVWLLRRVGIGIFKVIMIIGGISLLVWLIWGEGENIKTELSRAKKINIETSVQKIKDKISDSIPEKSSESLPDSSTEEVNEVKYQEEEAVSIKDMQPHLGGLNLASWNYWMENRRIQQQAGTPGDVMRWKRDTESFFEIPFATQVSGENNIQRSRNISQMLQRIESLLIRADSLQAILGTEITEYTNLSNYAQTQSLEAERNFLEAMKNSDPNNIGSYLVQKGEAEKDLQRYAVAAEGRRIFSQKISEYAQVLDSVKTAVTVNRRALEEDIQVVEFPSDPFRRVIPLESWQAN